MEDEDRAPVPKKALVNTIGAPVYAGFVAGVFSGITKLAVGHPFDTIKVRLQTSSETQFRGPMDCLMQTLRKEGVRGLYKGATPPLIGWMVMDSVMLGSMHNYRRLLKDSLYKHQTELPTSGKALAGLMAGITVSFVAAPVEHVKARLQVQYDARTKVYSGPIDCAMRLWRDHGLLHGLYRGLFATMLFRTNFLFFWGSYDLMSKWLETNVPTMSTAAISFWAGGMSANVFWLTAYPSDVVKQQIMTDSMDKPRYKTWWQAASAVYQNRGWRGYFRGFVPSMLRSFPANAAAIATFEGIMRLF